MFTSIVKGQVKAWPFFFSIDFANFLLTDAAVYSLSERVD
uniref:Uncharacterized protein n=1 Tax=uncultured bacterium A1Q1_fos_2111 TaxID=1256563 RepID=L7VYC7_9BACT|nr:hypothetical protein [uncultured bacterium A1Q1_fos_2111]